MAHLQKINQGVSRQEKRANLFRAAISDINSQTLLPRSSSKHQKVKYKWSRNLRRDTARNYVHENWGE